MTVRGEIVPTGEARGARLGVRGKNRISRPEVFAACLWPRASRPLLFSKEADGASAVEFALVLPLLLMLILGMVEFGTLFYRQAIISWSSREAARTGIVQAVPKPTVGQVQAVVSSVLSKSGLGTSPVAVTVTGAGGAFGTDLTVLVESPYRFQFLPAFAPGMASSVTLRGRTVMRNE